MVYNEIKLEIENSQEGSGNTTLNIGQVGMKFNNDGSISSFTGITGKVELNNDYVGGGGFLSDTGPALAAHANQWLFLAWKGAGSNALSIVCMLPDLKMFLVPFPTPGNHPPEYSPSQPSLVSHNGSLFISWRGAPNNFLNVAPVEFSEQALVNPIVYGVSGFSSKKLIISSETSNYGPSLASVRNLLFLSWTDSSNTLCVMASDNNAGSFVHKGISSGPVVPSTGNGPSLTWYNDQCYVAWTQLNSNYLWVAYTGLSGNLTDLNLETQSGRIIQDTGSSMPGNFYVLVRQLKGVVELGLWNRNNSDINLKWASTAAVVPPLPRTTITIGSITQSSVGKPNYPGNFEVLVLTGLRELHDLEHWSLDNTKIPPAGLTEHQLAVLPRVPDLLYRARSIPPSSVETWVRGQVIPAVAASFGSIVQSNKNASSDLVTTPGNFEALFLEEGVGLVHYTKQNASSGAGAAWEKTEAVSTSATGPATLIQSTFGAPSGFTNLEAVVLEGKNLVHYWLNMSDPSGGWQATQVISSNATGPGTIMQSNYGLPENLGKFEVVVLEGETLMLYERDNSDLTWSSGAVITPNALG